MTVSVSLVLLFGIALFFLFRSRALGFGAGLIAILFGLFLGDTGAAEPIRSACAHIAQLLHQNGL